jgi:hypothetical protein
MPSIHFLLTHLETSSFFIDKEKAFYIVDPGGDLEHTKAKFKTFFESKTNWNGIVGIPPGLDQFKKALTEHDLFM